MLDDTSPGLSAGSIPNHNLKGNDGSAQTFVAGNKINIITNDTSIIFLHFPIILVFIILAILIRFTLLYLFQPLLL